MRLYTFEMVVGVHTLYTEYVVGWGLARLWSEMLVQRYGWREDLLFGFEPLATTTSSHDSLHEREEPISIFSRRHRAYFML